MDDEVLGCGGTIVRHINAGDHVTVCVVANRAYNHKYDPKLIEQEKASCKKAQAILSYQDLVFLDLPDEQLDHSQIKIIIRNYLCGEGPRVEFSTLDASSHQYHLISHD